MKVKLQEQPFQVLAILLQRAGDLVAREELLEKLWAGDSYGDFDHSLNIAINKIREALNDSAESPRFIETLPKRGYRFIAPATVIEPPTPAAVAAPDKEPRSEDRRSFLKLAAGGVAALGAVAGGLAVGLNIGGSRDGLRWKMAPQQIDSIAVLPLENISGDPQQDYFADRMTDALIADLGQVGELRVISRTSVMGYKGTKKTLPGIARELNVDAIVEGTVLRSGDRVRITAQLLHALTDRHLWAQSYERDLRDILGL